MRHQIEAMVYGYIEKNHKDEPRLIDTLPAGMLEKWRKIEKLGGKPSFRKRRHWGVEDTGPADPLPIMDGPPTAPIAEKIKRHKPANVLVPFKAFDVASLPRRRWLLDQHYMRGVVSITAVRQTTPKQLKSENLPDGRPATSTCSGIFAAALFRFLLRPFGGMPLCGNR